MALLEGGRLRLVCACSQCAFVHNRFDELAIQDPVAALGYLQVSTCYPTGALYLPPKHLL